MIFFWRIFGAKIQLQKIRKNRGKNSWFWGILARKFKFNLVILYIILGAKIQTFKANKYGGTRTTPMSKFLTFEQKKSVGNKRKCCVVSLVKKSFFFSLVSWQSERQQSCTDCQVTFASSRGQHTVGKNLHFVCLCIQNRIRTLV